MTTGNEIYAIFTVIIGIAFFVKLVMVKKYSKNYLELKNKIVYLQEMKALKEKMRGTEYQQIMKNSNLEMQELKKGL